MTSAPRIIGSVAAAAVVLALTTVVAGAGAAPSAAATGTCMTGGCLPDGAPATGSATDGTIAVSVWGNGVRAGGGTFGGGTVVHVPVPCYFIPSETGAEYFAAWEPGGHHSIRDNAGSVDYLLYKPHAGYEQYKDVDGRWYLPHCNSFVYEGADFVGHQTGFVTQNPPVFVPTGTAPPVPEISVEMLRDVAMEEMEIPVPAVDWNPRIAGNDATLVNMETWVWLTDPTTLFSVTAEAGGNSARVDATFREMTLSAPGADGATCAGPGVAWSPAADDGCVIVFGRSSANQPGLRTPLTITTGWDASWSANGVLQGALDAQTQSAVANVPVAESQTVITRSR